MSLISAKYLEPARKRDGVHYYAKNDPATGKEYMAAKFWHVHHKGNEQSCLDCHYTPLWKAESCPRCGGRLVQQ